MVLAIAVIAVAYLIGSIPFSYLVARASGVTDVRRVGSGNVGATNVMRSGEGQPASWRSLLDGQGCSRRAARAEPRPGQPGLPAVGLCAA